MNPMMNKSMVCLWIHALTVLPMLNGETTRTLSTSKWYQMMQRLGNKYEKGETGAETKKRWADLVDAIAAANQNVTLIWSAKIKDVRWKEGVAGIYTEVSLDVTKITRKDEKLRLFRTLPFELKMTQSQAIKVKKGMTMKFKGKLIFHPRKWGAVGRATKSQQLYTVRHKTLGGASLGTFTSKEYQCKINNTAFQGVWAE